MYYPYQWINAHTVVAMDTTERIHLISVKDDSEIEVQYVHSVIEVQYMHSVIEVQYCMCIVWLV